MALSLSLSISYFTHYGPLYTMIHGALSNLITSHVYITYASQHSPPRTFVLSLFLPISSLSHSRLKTFGEVISHKIHIYLCTIEFKDRQTHVSVIILYKFSDISRNPSSLILTSFLLCVFLFLYASSIFIYCLHKYKYTVLKKKST